MFTIEQINDPRPARSCAGRMTMTFYAKAGRKMLVEQIS